MTKPIIAAVLLTFGIQTAWAADKTPTVTIAYNGKTVKVTNKQKKVKVTANGAQVVVDNQLTDQEVTFVLEGTTDNGSFEYNGAYKTTIRLNGLSLKANEGCALNLKCGKRTKIQLADATDNSLEDGTDTLHKACIYTKGHLEFSGEGSLSLKANAGNAIQAKEFIQERQQEKSTSAPLQAMLSAPTLRSRKTEATSPSPCRAPTRKLLRPTPS